MFVQTDVTTILAWARELAIIGGILVFGWKARDAFQNIVDFQKCITDFMRDMRGFAHRVESNHIRHIEEYLFKIAKDRNIITVVPPDVVETDDVDPPQEEV